MKYHETAQSLTNSAHARYDALRPHMLALAAELDSLRRDLPLARKLARHAERKHPGSVQEKALLMLESHILHMEQLANGCSLELIAQGEKQ